MRQAWVGLGRAGTHVAAEGEAHPRVGGRGHQIYPEGGAKRKPKVTGIPAQAAGRMELLCISKIEKAVSEVGLG